MMICSINHMMNSVGGMFAFLAIAMATTEAASTTQPGDHVKVDAAEFDTNGRPGLQETEMEPYCAAVAKELKNITSDSCMGNYRFVVQNASDGETYAIAAVNETFFPKKPEPRRQPFSFSNETCSSDEPAGPHCDGSRAIYTESPGLFLRRNHTQFRLYSPDSKARLGEGALVSFMRDISGDTNVTQARGAAMYPIYAYRRDEHRANGVPHIVDFGLIPSVSFNRLENNKTAGKDIDSLTFRLGADIYARHLPLFQDQFWWINATYDTDFEFESSILGVELDWRPISFDHEIGTIMQIPGLSDVTFYWQPWLHLEAGKVVDASRNTKLVDGFEFVRGGPGVKASMWFDKRLKIYAQAYYYRALKEDSQNDWNTTVGLEALLLPETDALALTIEYENGRLPFKLQRTEKVSAGVSLKF